MENIYKKFIGGFIVLGVLFGIAFGADNKVMANIAGSCFLVWAVVCGIYTNIIRPSELLNKA